MPTKLRVLLVDSRRDRSATLVRAMEEAGHQVVARVTQPGDLHDSVRSIDPDVVIVDTESPSRDVLEGMQDLSVDRPIVMFVDDGDADSIRAAMRAGVAAYVVKGASPDRVKAVVDVAIARFEEHREMKAELHRVKATLADRKLVDRAKGILMERRNLSEEDAYAALRRMAMNRNSRISEVARSVIEMAELL